MSLKPRIKKVKQSEASTITRVNSSLMSAIEKLKPVSEAGTLLHVATKKDFFLMPQVTVSSTVTLPIARNKDVLLKNSNL